MAGLIDPFRQDSAALRVFISYARRDREVADALVVALENAGIQVSIDRRDLPYGEEWQTELVGMMRASDAVVWLVSPHSVESTWCQWELGEVARLSKRLLPVCISAVDLATLPPGLGKLHVLPAEGIYDPVADRELLISTLETDKAWLKQGTALAERARQWHAPPDEVARSGPDASALLSGAQLRRAEAWRQCQPLRAPAPSQQVLDLILASRQAAVRRQRLLVLAAGVVAVLSLGLSAVAWWQRDLAVQRQQQALRNESRLLTGAAADLLGQGDAVTAALLALEALPDDGEAFERPFVPEAQRALYSALLEQREMALYAEPREDSSVSVQPAPNGKQVLTISANNTLRAYDLAGSKPPVVVQGTPGTVARAFWSPDGKRLAVVIGVDRQQVQLWDLSRQRQVFMTPLQASDFVHAVAFSPDGRWFAMATSARGTSLHAADSSTPLWVIKGVPNAAATSVAFSPDGELLAVGDSAGGIELRDRAGGGLRWGRFGHGAGFEVTALHFTPDGRHLLATPMDGTAQLWRLGSGTAPLRPVLLAGHRDIVLASALSPDGSRFVTGSQDDSARLWRLPQGIHMAPPLTGHDGDVIDLAFSADGRRVHTVGQNAIVRVWRAEDGGLHTVLRGHAGLAGAAQSADGRQLITIGRDTVRVWSMASLAQRGLLSGHSGWVTGAVFSPDGSRLISFGHDQRPGLWNTESGERLAELAAPQGRPVAASFTVDGAEALTLADDGTLRRWDGFDGAPLGRVIEGLPTGGLGVISPGANRLLITDSQGRATLREMTRGEVIATLDVPGAATLRKPVALASFSTDGRHLLTMGEKEHEPGADGVTVLGYDDQAMLWNASTGALIASFDGERQSISRAALHPAGHQLALLLRDGTVLVYATADKRLLMRLQPPAAANPVQGLRSLEYSADGRLLLRAWRGTGQVLDAQDGRQIAALDGGAGAAGHAAFTPDGRGVISYAGNAALLWDAQTGEPVAKLAGHILPISALAVAPSGAQLATASHDGTVRLWPMLIDRRAIIDRARQVLPRCLGAAERERLHLSPQLPCWCQRLQKWSPPTTASRTDFSAVVGGRACGP